jgi:arylsulfatase A-like enzyme
MHNRREFLRNSAVAAAASLTASQRLPGSQRMSLARERPNILLILADDMGFSDLGCYGSEIETPNLDQLANEGIRFSQFYNSPRCCPSRASLLTGLYSHQAGMGLMTSDHGRYPYPAYDGDLSKGCITIAEALRAGGYRTMMSGKWHLSPLEDTNSANLDKSNWPLQRGFDRFYGIIAGAANYYDPATLVRDDTPIREDASDFYFTDGIADNAVSFLEEAAKQAKPFLMYTAFNSPHWPLQAPETAVAKYRERYRMGWDQARVARHARQIKSGLVDPHWKVPARDSRVPAWSRASFKDWEIERMAVYAAQVDLMDQGIGRIVSKLTELGVKDNTLVLFMSDNGGNYEEIGGLAPNEARPIYMPKVTREGKPVIPGNLPTIMPGPATTFQSYGAPWGNVSNTPFRLYKHYAHEGGISTPLIACWPREIRDRGSITRQVGHEVDIMATCLDITGTPYPASSKAGTPPPPLEGRSLRPVFQSGKIADRGMLFWEHEGNCAARDGNWKLVSAFPNNWELYDMNIDRTETTNLADANPERVDRMAAAYKAWAKRVGAQPWPMPQTPPGERNGRVGIPEYLKVDRP